MYCIYIIQHSISKQIYIGYTSNLKRRLIEHNENKTKSTARKFGKWILIYSEVFRDKADAINREKKLKHHGRAKQELKKRIRCSLLN